MAQVIVYENGNAIGGEGHPTNASDITFDSAGTDLVSEEVESAIKEVNAKTQHGVFELWTNPSPTASFAGQTINITQTDLDNRGLNVNVNDIDVVDISFGTTSTSSRAFSRILVGGTATANTVSTDGTSSIVIVQRGPITVSRNSNTISITFPDCRSYQIVPSSQSSVSNIWMVPMIITGLIHNN